MGAIKDLYSEELSRLETENFGLSIEAEIGYLFQEAVKNSLKNPNLPQEVRESFLKVIKNAQEGKIPSFE